MTKERFGNESKVGSAHAWPVSEVASDQPKGRLLSLCKDGWIGLVRKKHRDKQPKFSYIHI